MAGSSIPAGIAPRPIVPRIKPLVSGRMRDLLGGPSRIVRDHGELGPSLGRLGSLEVRLALTTRDIRRAQRLRYKIFFEEMSASAKGASMFSRRDVDHFDRLCDHLLVLDHGASNVGAARTKPKVVGTYRLLRQDIAERNQGFYTAGEYDIAPMLTAHPQLRFLELGRSCVLKPYRTKRTVELLWAGIWAYVLHHRIDVMIGCASLEGTDPRAFSLPLSFLHHFARASGDWQASAWPQHGTSMNLLPREAIDQKAALRALPPLIKGYLRLGASFGSGAVIDRRFGTTDVLVILPVTHINPRYIGHFGADASRHVTLANSPLA